MLSVLELPRSEAGSRSGTEGAAGGVVSIVTGSAAEATLALPAVSVAVAVMRWAPLVSVEVAML